MVREREVQEGRKVLRELLERRSRRHPRFHTSAAEDAFARLRALDGICGSCQNVKISVYYKDGKRVVGVNCKAGHSPLKLYYNTPIGEEADCPDWTEARPLK